MALLTWSTEYSVAVEVIDKQHQQLFAMLNELHDAMKAARARNRRRAFPVAPSAGSNALSQGATGKLAPRRASRRRPRSYPAG
jgi:hypothetical protein